MAVGLLSVGASTLAPNWIQPIWFWSEADRGEHARLGALHEKMTLAYRAESQRRSNAGAPVPPTPPALDKVRAQLARSSATLERAQRRPAQIAAALRYTGAALCLLGLALLALKHPARPSPTARAPGQ